MFKHLISIFDINVGTHRLNCMYDIDTHLRFKLISKFITVAEEELEQSLQLRATGISSAEVSLA